MKTAITSTGDELTSKMDLRFGRTSYICIYDNENGSTSFFQNENKNLNGGAGTKTAEKIAELGAGCVISGDFGPKAKSLLERMKIQMIIPDNESKTIEEIISELKN